MPKDKSDGLEEKDTKSKKKAKSKKSESAIESASVDQIEGEEVQKVLSIALSDEEKNSKKCIVSDLTSDLLGWKAKKAAAIAEFSPKIKDLDKQISKLQAMIDSGFEDRNVTCKIVKNYDDNKIEYWHDGKIAESREMTAQDRQLDLKTVKKVAAEAAEPLVEKDNVVSMNKTQSEDIQDVIKSETKRSTKKSSVDGVYPH